MMSRKSTRGRLRSDIVESASKGNAIVARYHRGLPILYTSACVGIMRWLVAAFEGVDGCLHADADLAPATDACHQHPLIVWQCS